MKAVLLVLLISSSADAAMVSFGPTSSQKLYQKLNLLEVVVNSGVWRKRENGIECFRDTRYKPEAYSCEIQSIDDDAETLYKAMQSKEHDVACDFATCSPAKIKNLGGFLTCARVAAKYFCQIYVRP